MTKEARIALGVIFFLALLPLVFLGGALAQETHSGSILVPTAGAWMETGCSPDGRQAENGFSFWQFAVEPDMSFELRAASAPDDFDIDFLKEEFRCGEDPQPTAEPHTNGDSDETGIVPFDAKVAIAYLWLGEPGAEFTFALLPPPAPDFSPASGRGVPQADKVHTVVAVVDSGFSPYHFDFVGHNHPWNSDDDPNNDFDSFLDPARYLEDYPGATPINLTIPLRKQERVDKYSSGRDADEWLKLEKSTDDEVKMYWFPGTKVIGAVDFDPDFDFYADNSSHGTRSAASAAGNIHGSCPECLFVLINGAEPQALAWAASQSWIDVVTNSYGHSLSGGLIRDNIYFGSALDATRNSSEEGQFVVFSAGNGLLNAFDVPMLTYWSSEKGPDWMITVGAASPRGKQQYSGAGKPVDVSSIGASYPSTGGVTATGVGTHSGTSNAAPVTAGTIARLIQMGREALGDTNAGHRNGIVAEGAKFQCGKANRLCPLSDGILTRAEVQDLMFKNVLPSPGRVEFDTIWPGTQYSYYYQGHGVIRGRIDGDQTFADEHRQFLEAMRGNRPFLTRPSGEESWFVVDSKCRQTLWGEWSRGYYRGSLPPLDPIEDPIAHSFNEWCSGTAEQAFYRIAEEFGDPSRGGGSTPRHPSAVPTPASAEPSQESQLTSVLSNNLSRPEFVDETPVTSVEEAEPTHKDSPTAQAIDAVEMAEDNTRRNSAIIAVSLLVIAGGFASGVRIGRRRSHKT